MATLINGNGNTPVTAQQDADFFQGILGGDFVKMLPVGSQMAYTIEDANTISLADGECVDSEGRRIHIDVGYEDSFTIPTGTSGSTKYYIIGYMISEDSDGDETASAFVTEVSSASATIDEGSLRDGASSKYISLYRVTQTSLTISAVEALYTVLTGITGKLDGETLVTTLSEAVNAGEEAAPACSVIAEMYENFQDGCSTIAAALNSAGVTTASNASPSTMANNIANIYGSRYNAGYSAAMVGNATAARVLNGYTFTNASNVGATGSMNNWGSNTVNMSSNTATLSAGYYSSISINAASRYTAGYNAKTMTVTSLGSNGATRNSWSLSSSSLTWNAANISGYGNFTASNFAITALSTSGMYYAYASAIASVSASLSYNSSSGIVTMSGIGDVSSSYGASIWVSSATVKCYHT